MSKFLKKLFFQYFLAKRKKKQKIFEAVLFFLRENLDLRSSFEKNSARNNLCRLSRLAAFLQKKILIFEFFGRH